MLEGHIPSGSVQWVVGKRHDRTYLVVERAKRASRRPPRNERPSAAAHAFAASLVSQKSTNLVLRGCQVQRRMVRACPNTRDERTEKIEEKREERDGRRGKERGEKWDVHHRLAFAIPHILHFTPLGKEVTNLLIRNFTVGIANQNEDGAVFASLVSSSWVWRRTQVIVSRK